MPDSPLKYVYENSGSIFEDLLGIVQQQIGKIEANRQLAQQMAQQQRLIQYKSDLDLRNTLSRIDAQRRSDVQKETTLSPIRVQESIQKKAGDIQTQSDMSGKLLDIEAAKTRGRAVGEGRGWIENREEMEARQNAQIDKFGREEGIKFGFRVAGDELKAQREGDREWGNQAGSPTITSAQTNASRAFVKDYNGAIVESRMGIPKFTLVDGGHLVGIINIDGDDIALPKEQLDQYYSIAQSYIDLRDQLRSFSLNQDRMDTKSVVVNGITYIGTNDMESFFNLDVAKMVLGDENELNKASEKIREYGSTFQPNLFNKGASKENINKFRMLSEDVIEDVNNFLNTRAGKKYKDKGITIDDLLDVIGVDKIQKNDFKKFSSSDARDAYRERLEDIRRLYLGLPVTGGREARYLNLNWNSKLDDDSSLFSPAYNGAQVIRTDIGNANTNEIKNQAKSLLEQLNN